MPFADREKQKAYMREYAQRQRDLFKKLKAEQLKTKRGEKT